jgi:predicted phosphodiesterase
MRIALLADIHGNLPALSAVMAELERLQPDHVVLDGDLINGAPFSAEVVAVVQRQPWTVVRGNHEFYLLDYGTERATPGSDDPKRWGQLHWLAEQLTPAQVAYLALLPDERTLFLPGTQPLGVAHGVPGRNRVGFHTETPEALVAAELAGVTARTFISAHTHVQVDRQIRRQATAKAALIPPPTPQPLEQWHLINPGSVGMPLNATAAAQFALVEAVPEAVEPGGWRATFYNIPYDRRPALAAYATSGMAAAGGVMTQLFYWQLVTAHPEVIYFFHWAYEQGLDPNQALDEVFCAYVAATGRDQYVRARDPLYGAGSRTANVASPL